MQTQDLSIPLSEDERARSALQIIETLRTRIAAGESVDDEDILRQNSHLAPDLGIQLRIFRRMHPPSASPAATPAPTDEHEETREFLQSHLSQYVIGECIAHGGQGVVFRARQAHTHRDVAIKVLVDGAFASRHRRERFMREIELAGRLAHPYIVTVFESGTIGNRPYCVMEYIDGEPIDDHVLLEMPTIRPLLELFSSVCEAVSHAHQRGVIHRDLKPANILIDSNGNPKILDFGLAKSLIETPEERSVLSMTGQFIGTLPYQSPEQLIGDLGAVDVRADIYALGVILYQLLTGRFPYDVEGSYDEVRSNVLTVSPTALKSVSTNNKEKIPADIEAILRKSLEKNPSNRYQSAESLSEDIRRYLNGEPVVARGDMRFYVLRKTVHRYRVPIALMVAFLGILIVASATSTVLWLQARQARDQSQSNAAFAHHTLSTTVNGIVAEVSRMAGGQIVVEEMHKILDDDLSKLPSQLGAGPETIELLARVEINKGNGAERRGDRRTAEDHFRAALRLVANVKDDNDDLLALRIEALTRLGHVVNDWHEPVNNAIRLATEAFARTDESIRFQTLLCAAYAEAARRASLMGDSTLAAENAASAIALEPDEDRPASEILPLLREVAVAREWAATAQFDLGQCDLAEQHLTAGAGLLDRVIQIRPMDFLARQDRARMNIRQYDILRGRDRLSQAKDYLDLAIDESEHLRATDSTEAAWTRDLLAAYIRRIDFEFRGAEKDRAWNTLIIVEDILDELAPAMRSDLRTEELAASALIRRGELLKAEGNLESAFEALHEAELIYEAIDSQSPEDVQTENQLAYCYWQLACFYKDDGQLDAAADYISRCLQLRESLFQQNPYCVDRHLDLLLASFVHARIVRAMGGDDNLARALVEFEDIETPLAVMAADPTRRCHLKRIRPTLKKARGNIQSIKAMLDE